MAEDKKPKYKEEDFINQLNKEFSYSFFNSDDLKAAASVGLYYKLLSYQQESRLGTRTLVKDARYLLSDLDKIKLFKIFDHINQVAFVIKDKDRKSQLSYSSIRVLTEDYLKKATWDVSTEELSLAFIIGYDSWLRTIRKIDPEEINKLEEENE